MPIKLTYAQLNEPALFQSLNALAAEKDFPEFKTAYSVSKLVRRIRNELRVAAEHHKEIIMPFVEKDEAGKAKTDERGGVTIAPEKKAEWDEKLQQFLDHEVEFDVDPIKVTELGAIKLSPNDILALEPIFDKSSLQARGSDATN